jgi:FKBP-type peptidyl-prolyl cis-trans isomerase FkpA
MIRRWRPLVRGKPIHILALVAFAALHAAACSGAEEAPPVQRQATRAASDSAVELQFAPALGIHLDSMTTKASGVHVQDLKTGDGAVAVAGKRVTVEYRAWLSDGTLYEERPNAEGWGASEFLLGPGAPVPGLIDGIEGMRVGGVRRIVVPAERGYGLVGRPAAVPAASILIFQVRLTGVHDE